LYGFVLLSTGFTVLVSVAYSLAVSNRVEEIDRTSNVNDEPRSDREEASRGFYVFYFYFLHLVVRSLFGILFTVLQYTVFYSRGFDFEFSCNLPTSDVPSQTQNNMRIGKLNNTSIACENSTSSEKQLWSVIVSVLSTAFALIILGEVIYLWRQFPILNCRSEVGWSCDSEFITVYLLRKQYMRVELRLATMDNDTPTLSITPDDNIADNSTPNYSTPDYNIANRNSPDNITDNSTADNIIADISFQDCSDYYRQQVLNRPRAYDISYGQKTDLDDVYIDVIIHTKRAPHIFSKEMERHEIFDVYMKVPKNSIRLEKVRDLFYPNKDTKGNSPRTILAVGRPGIGKTVLTEKIIRDWGNGIDEFYRGKIAFSHKFRWFNFEKLKNLSLKTFLRHGTELSEKEFESIFQEILKEPQKAVFIFDGLDEFNGDMEYCLEQSRMLPNDPNAYMSGMTLFIKLAYGKMLQGATIIVTSRPIADDFYSKLHFDRSVEIIGFTSEKIEEYVSRFCDNSDRGDLKPKVWNHIKSSSDLLNLCYIPVNCFIVCVTLSACLSDSGNDTGALPTRLTQLYDSAIKHFAKKHDRNSNKTFSKQTAMDLQEVALRGMENGQLVFNEQYFHEGMKRSGLINCLSNPISPIQTQFCFIHLTIQEFLAAKHVTETLSPEEIEKFIFAHIDSGKWHLVLQFIAGLVGEKTKMSGSDYHDCIMAFAKGLTLNESSITLKNYGNLLVLKCLREVDDEYIVKKACEKTDLKLLARLHSSNTFLSASDWEAVTFVCKHLKNLVDLEFTDTSRNANPFMSVGKLLEQKCLERLVLATGKNTSTELAKEVLDAMMKSNCPFTHEHAKLRHLCLTICMTDECVSYLCAFIKNGHASHLQVLKLSNNGITSNGISQLCEVLNDICCRELTSLNLNGNDIGNEGVRMLCHALIGHCKLKELSLGTCSLTAGSMRYLCEVLCDEHCKLTDFSLINNDIGDEGIRTLCADALRKQQCELTILNLDSCSLTANCMHALCEVLQDEHCKLTDLSLSDNDIGDEGVRILCTGSLRGEQCKLTRLNLSFCSLTANCILEVCKVLVDEHCKLSELVLSANAIGDDGVRMLCTNALEEEECKLTALTLDYCDLTDKCVPLLCETLQHGNCKLTELALASNEFTEDGKNLLCNVERTECCKARGFRFGEW
jgi:Ran GTPase-activating protein (RanGAP) involved in mRNA processing and transport